MKTLPRVRRVRGRNRRFFGIELLKIYLMHSLVYTSNFEKSAKSLHPNVQDPLLVRRGPDGGGGGPALAHRAEDHRHHRAGHGQGKTIRFD